MRRTHAIETDHTHHRRRMWDKWAGHCGTKRAFLETTTYRSCSAFKIPMKRFIIIVSWSSRKPFARSDVTTASFSSERVSQMSRRVDRRSIARMCSSAFTSGTSRMSRGIELYACWNTATNSCFASGRVRKSANSTRRAWRYARSPSWISRISENDRASDTVYCSSAIFQRPSRASAS